ncbi:hypothetical protein ACHAPD_007041 [Fusarium lateritium]
MVYVANRSTSRRRASEATLATAAAWTESAAPATSTVVTAVKTATALAVQQRLLPTQRNDQ